MNAEEATLRLLAAAGLDTHDEEVMARLGGLVRVLDPVPDDLVDRVGMALTMEALHAEIAHLERMPAALTAVRSEEASIEADTITFTTDVLTVMVSLHDEGGRVRLDGWLAPAAALAVEVHQGAAMVATTSDEDGRFSVEGLDHAPTRLVLRRPDAPDSPVVTPQVEI